VARGGHRHDAAPAPGLDISSASVRPAKTRPVRHAEGSSRSPRNSSGVTRRGLHVPEDRRAWASPKAEALFAPSNLAGC
jgi:hypothetical protein